MNTRLLYLQALSPLHAGTGQSIGAVDLAIARDRASNFPYLPGSSLKGALRARAYDRVEASKLDASRRIHVFGPETANASEHAGALIFGDANLLLLPVRSVAGTFAWTTSPFLLQRYARDCAEAQRATPQTVPPVTNINQALVTDACALLADNRIIFEDLDFQAVTNNNETKAWAEHLAAALFPGHEAWRRMLQGRFCILHDDAMAFLAEHATDVVTRVSIDLEKKTAKNGQLWTEESLPCESILVSLVASMGNGKIKAGEAFDVLQGLCNVPLQLGGKATVGRGRCQLTLSGGKA